MEKVDKIMPQLNSDLFDLQADIDEIRNNKYFSLLTDGINFNDSEISLRYASINTALIERENCANCPGIQSCPNDLVGYKKVYKRVDGVINESFSPCDLKINSDKVAEIKSRIIFENMPKNLEMASFDKLYLKSGSSRDEAIKNVFTFFKNYNSKPTKGYYLYGNYGVGKSYMMAALLNKLAENYNIQGAMICLPEYINNLKLSFKTNFSQKLEDVKKVDILVIDDLGAENISQWSRDEILGSILQYRMQENLVTFFTSNFSIKDLIDRYNINNSNTDKVLAERIVERIKVLSKEVYIHGKNYRE